jgi:hypothetical protein
MAVMADPVQRIEQLLRRCRAELNAQLAALRRVRTAELRLTAATRILKELRSAQRAVAVIRDAALIELAESGRSYTQVAALAGLTRGRIAQVVRRSRLAGDSTDGQRPAPASSRAN